MFVQIPELSKELNLSFIGGDIPNFQSDLLRVYDFNIRILVSHRKEYIMA